MSQRSLESVAVCTGECGRFFFSCISRKHGLSVLGLVSLSGSRRKEDRKGRRQACVCVYASVAASLTTGSTLVERVQKYPRVIIPLG